MHKITFEQIEDKVRSLVRAAPDNKYDTRTVPDAVGACSYIHGSCSNGSTGCIFGQALLLAGLDRDLLAKTEEKLLEEQASGIKALLRELKIEPGTFWLDWADALQGEQDGNSNWSDALAYADRQFPIKG